MSEPGALRLELSDRLSAAYGLGLLSEQTFAARLDTVLSGHLLDPESLIGDLHLRAEGGLRHRFSTTVSALALRLGDVLRGPSDPVPLLALAWAGARSELVLGRSSSCDVVLTGSSVSRRHARLRWRDGRWILQDIGLRNGTQLNGRPVVRCEVRPGDLLALGDQLLRVD